VDGCTYFFLVADVRPACLDVNGPGQLLLPLLLKLQQAG